MVPLKTRAPSRQPKPNCPVAQAPRSSCSTRPSVKDSFVRSPSEGPPHPWHCTVTSLAPAKLLCHYLTLCTC